MLHLLSDEINLYPFNFITTRNKIIWLMKYMNKFFINKEVGKMFVLRYFGKKWRGKKGTGKERKRRKKKKTNDTNISLFSEKMMISFIT